MDDCFKKNCFLFKKTCFFCFASLLLAVAVQRPSQRLHRWRLFFRPLNGTENGSPPSLTTLDRELISVLEVRIEPGDLNPRPLTSQSVTLLTLPRAGLNLLTDMYFSKRTYNSINTERSALSTFLMYTDNS